MNFPSVSFVTLLLISICYGAHVSVRGPDARAGEPEPPVTPGPDSVAQDNSTAFIQRNKDASPGEPEPPVTPGPDSVAQDYSTDILVHSQWQNELDRLLHVECPDGEGFYGFQSIHDNGAEDRVFEFNCRRTTKTSVDDSYWTDFVNGYDGPSIYLCAPNFFLCGIESIHDNGSEDRIFKYKCCHAEFHFTMHCGMTDDLNDFDGPVDYHVDGAQQVMTGMYSYHDNGTEDRRFRAIYCEYKSCH